MDFSGEKKINAARQRVWEALNDPLILKECILGCEELEKTSDTEMTAIVAAKFGPVKAKFKTEILIEDVNEACSCKLVGKGQGGVAGFASGIANLRLEDDDEGTLICYEVDFSVGGKIAQIGARLLSGTTTKIVNHFFDVFPEQL